MDLWEEKFFDGLGILNFEFEEGFKGGMFLNLLKEGGVEKLNEDEFLEMDEWFD